MPYTPYYSGGWQSGEQGGTPITPAALNNMEAGIGAALTSEDVVNNLTSTATDKPGSANMLKTLNGKISLLIKREGFTLAFTNGVATLPIGIGGISTRKVLSVAIDGGWCAAWYIQNSEVKIYGFHPKAGGNDMASDGSRYCTVNYIGS